MSKLARRLRRMTRMLKSGAAAEAEVEETTEEEETKTAFDSAMLEVRKGLGQTTDDEETDTEDTETEETDSEEEDKEEVLKMKGAHKMKGKGKKKKGMNDDEEEEGKDSEKASPFTRSLAEEIEEDPEAQGAIDVEPFLEAFVKSVDRNMKAMSKEIASLRKSVANVAEIQKSHAGLTVEAAEMTQAVAKTVNAVGNQPEPRKGQVSVQDRFEKSQGGADYDARAIRAKLGALAKSGALKPLQVGVIEGRLNRGEAMPDWFQPILADSGE
jgi:hypothetical protein